VRVRRYVIFDKLDWVGPCEASARCAALEHCAGFISVVRIGSFLGCDKCVSRQGDGVTQETL
jgi:hypothetical protein